MGIIRNIVVPFLLASATTTSFLSSASAEPLKPRQDGALDDAYSPPFYPSPQAKGFTSNWANAIGKAEYLLRDTSLEELVNISTGIGWQNGPCVGNIASNEDIGFPGLCLQDSPLGARFIAHGSAFPAGITSAATWDKDLIRKRGEAMGIEAKQKGINVLLGPMLNMGRLAAGGRNWEGFGADPYLTGEASYETVIGIQSQNVQACAKHYINNEQEHYRNTESSNVDDRTQHEMYLAPFLRTVQAETASIMCSYNLINNSWACQNSYLLNGALKTELAYDGYVMTDWGAHHSGVASANAGLDMSMPGDVTLGSGTTYWGPHLVEAANNGSVDPLRVRDMAVRIIAAWYLVHQDTGFPAVSFDSWEYDPQQDDLDVQDNHAKLIRQIDAAGTVLLKNKDNKALPLHKPKSIAVIGNDAGPSFAGAQYSGSGGPGAEQAQGKPSTGVVAMGWGSGTAFFPYLIDPLHALQERAIKDRTMIDWWLDNNDTENAARIAEPAQAALVFVGSTSGEEYVTIDGNMGDRNNLSAWWQGDQLVKSVADVNENTIVVVHSVGPMLMEEWIEHPNVTAVVWCNLPGQEAGNSLVDVLYGSVNPSGRLPYTIAKQREDYGVDVVYQNSSEIEQMPYHEGLLFDYRHFDANEIVPRFEFGFGLSYTKFGYSNLQVNELGYQQYQKRDDGDGDGDDDEEHKDLYGRSVRPELHKKTHKITVNVKNTGDKFGHEVVQLYLGFPPEVGEPPKVLRGFERVGLQPGESRTVSFEISQYDTSFWSVEKQDWENALWHGDIDVLVAASSRDVRARHYLHKH